MANIALLFRDEIRRLAAREVRKLGRASRQFETRFKNLQKRNRLLQKRLTVLSRQLSSLRVELDRRVAPARQDRLLIPREQLPSPQEVRYLRRSLGMSRLAFAKRLGVSPGSIFGWETGRTVPRGTNAARVRALAEKATASGRRAKAKAPVKPRKPARRRRAGRRPARRRSH